MRTAEINKLEKVQAALHRLDIACENCNENEWMQQIQNKIKNTQTSDLFNKLNKLGLKCGVDRGADHCVQQIENAFRLTANLLKNISKELENCKNAKSDQLAKDDALKTLHAKVENYCEEEKTVIKGINSYLTGKLTACEELGATRAGAAEAAQHELALQEQAATHQQQEAQQARVHLDQMTSTLADCQQKCNAQERESKSMTAELENIREQLTECKTQYNGSEAPAADSELHTVTPAGSVDDFFLNLKSPTVKSSDRSNLHTVGEVGEVGEVDEVDEVYAAFFNSLAELGILCQDGPEVCLENIRALLQSRQAQVDQLSNTLTESQLTEKELAGQNSSLQQINNLFNNDQIQNKMELSSIKKVNETIKKENDTIKKVNETIKAAQTKCNIELKGQTSVVAKQMLDIEGMQDAMLKLVQQKIDLQANQANETRTTADDWLHAYEEALKDRNNPAEVDNTKLSALLAKIQKRLETIEET